MADIRALAEELVHNTSSEARQLNDMLREQYSIHTYGMPPVTISDYRTNINHHSWKDHSKAEAQRKKEIEKRRKKNKNKKTHRR